MEVQSKPVAPGRAILAAAAAIALFAVLVDASAETWRSGSPVRWWVAGAVAAYAAATALSWRRIGWRDRAALSGFVLLAVVAATAWLPFGLTAGITVAGARTPVVLSVVTAGAFILAATVAWRWRVLPRVIRIAVLLVAAYAIAAVVDGLSAGVPFTDLFSGQSLWRRLPSWLQGGFLGAVVVLPLALLVSIVRAGIPRFREGSPRHALYQAVALATSFALVLSALPGAASWRSDARGRIVPGGFAVPVATPIVPSQELSALLENSLRAIEDGERESARDRWDPAYVVGEIGADPRRLLRWVTESTVWIPYRGVLRGPAGVLMDRMGSSLDRALLLARLLKEAGHPVRLAHGELTAEQSAALVPVLTVARAGGAARGAHAAATLVPVGLKQAAGQYALDGPAIEQSLTRHAADNDRVMSDLRTRAAEQSRRLRAAIGATAGGDSRGDRLERAAEILRDHWWVQRQEGATWIDLDPLSQDGRALTDAKETAPIDGLDPGQFQQVVVRVVSEQWKDGRLSERVALQHPLRPAELIGKPVALRLWPRRWPAKIVPGSNPKQYIRTVALAQHEWLASLQIGRDTPAEASLLETGDVNEHPAVNDFAKVAGSSATAADDAGSVLRGLTPEQTRPTQAAKTVLTAAWLEFEIRVPGERPIISRRTVFDLVGPAARATSPVPAPGDDEATALVRSLSLMMETEILPVPCRIAPEFYHHLVAQSLLGNREVLRSIVRGAINAETNRDDLASKLTPIPGPLYPLAIARVEHSPVGDEIYLAAPNVFTRHVLPASLGGDRITLRDVTDIVANHVEVDLRVKDAFAVRLEQGVFDTNAETFLQARPGLAGNTANAYAASGDWVTLSARNGSELAGLRLPIDDRARVAQDLAAGSIVVAPRAPLKTAGDEYVGWWRVDPARGDALGVGDHMWGQASAGYMVLVSAVIGFELGWLMCEVPPPSLPSGPTARLATPVLDHFVVPLEASGGQCLVAGLVGAALSAILAMAGGAGFGGSRGGGGGGAGGGGGGGGGGNGAGGGGAGGGAAGAAAAGEGGGEAAAGQGGAGGGAGSAGPGGRYSGPGGASPAEEINPLGKTQPGNTARSAPKTEVSGPPEMEPPPSRPGAPPRTGPATPDDVANLQREAEAAQREATQATKDYVNYRALKPNPARGNPGDPSYDPVEDALKQDSMMQAAARRNEALSNLKQAEDALAAQRAAEQAALRPPRGLGFPPPRAPAEPARGFPGCPPNCGNGNKTGPPQDAPVPGSSKSIVGAAGVGKALGGQ